MTATTASQTPAIPRRTLALVAIIVTGVLATLWIAVMADGVLSAAPSTHHLPGSLGASWHLQELRPTALLLLPAIGLLANSFVTTLAVRDLLARRPTRNARTLAVQGGTVVLATGAQLLASSLPAMAL